MSTAALAVQHRYCTRWCQQRHRPYRVPQQITSHESRNIPQWQSKMRPAPTRFVCVCNYNPTILRLRRQRRHSWAEDIFDKCISPITNWDITLQITTAPPELWSVGQPTRARCDQRVQCRPRRTCRGWPNDDHSRKVKTGKINLSDKLLICLEVNKGNNFYCWAALGQKKKYVFEKGCRTFSLGKWFCVG